MKQVIAWYLHVLCKYAVFKGRAHRKEFWSFCLFNFIILFIIGVVFGNTIPGDPGLWVYIIYSLAIIIPATAVSVRRLHDTGRSGWWLLLPFLISVICNILYMLYNTSDSYWLRLTTLIPAINFFVMLYFYVQDSQPSENRFGPNPKQVSNALSNSRK